MKSVRERMDINAAYREVGTYRGAAEICGTTPKTVKRAVTAEATERRSSGRAQLRRGARTSSSSGSRRPRGGSRRSGCCRLARAAGYEGSARNFRRLVAEAKADWRVDNHRGRRPGVWAPGDMLVVRLG